MRPGPSAAHRVRAGSACRSPPLCEVWNAGGGCDASPMTLSCAMRTVRIVHPLGYRNAMYAAIMPG